MKNEITKTDLTPAFVNDVRKIIEQGRRQAYVAAGQLAIQTYWNIGQRIVEEEQHGEARAEYGTQLIDNLAKVLTAEYGSIYNARRLRDYRQFYLSFSNLQIWHARVPNLTWTHFRIIMRETSPEGRAWYVKEASEQMWSTRTLYAAKYRPISQRKKNCAVRLSSRSNSFWSNIRKNQCYDRKSGQLNS